MIEICRACDWLLDYGRCGCLPQGVPLGPVEPYQRDQGPSAERDELAREVRRVNEQNLPHPPARERKP